MLQDMRRPKLHMILVEIGFSLLEEALECMVALLVSLVSFLYGDHRMVREHACSFDFG